MNKHVEPALVTVSYVENIKANVAKEKPIQHPLKQYGKNSIKYLWDHKIKNHWKTLLVIILIVLFLFYRYRQVKKKRIIENLEVAYLGKQPREKENYRENMESFIDKFMNQDKHESG